MCPIIDGLDGRWLPPPCFTKVKGILSDEEIRRVEQIHQQHFAWEQRRWRLLEVIQGFVATSEFGELKMVEIGWSSFNMLELMIFSRESCGSYLRTLIHSYVHSHSHTYCICMCVCDLIRFLKLVTALLLHEPIGYVCLTWNAHSETCQLQAWNVTCYPWWSAIITRTLAMRFVARKSSTTKPPDKLPKPRMVCWSRSKS